MDGSEQRRSEVSRYCTRVLAFEFFTFFCRGAPKKSEPSAFRNFVTGEGAAPEVGARGALRLQRAAFPLPRLIPRCSAITHFPHSEVTLKHPPASASITASGKQL